MDLPDIPSWEGEPEEFIPGKPVSEQVQEDTCDEHGIFCCDLCFETGEFFVPTSDEVETAAQNLTAGTAYHLAHILNDALWYDPDFLDHLKTL